MSAFRWTKRHRLLRWNDDIVGASIRALAESRAPTNYFEFYGQQNNGLDKTLTGSNDQQVNWAIFEMVEADCPVRTMAG